MTEVGTYSPRCLDCGYVLSGLTEHRCPECGRTFDPDDPNSYSMRPLFVRWRFWLPGFALAVGAGSVLYLAILATAGWGVALTLVAPFCIGAIVGFGCRAKPIMTVLLSIVAVVAVMGMLGSMSFVGLFCGAAATAVALLPVVVGAFGGYILRLVLKSSQWDQRWYLPALLVLLAVFIGANIESRISRPYGVESVVTSIEVPASVGRLWNSLMFYEEVRQRPPWLLRYGLPRPLYARGSTAHVGDRKICVYTKGSLVKQVTRRDPGRLLAFDVVRQDRIEVHSIRLTDGSFAFTPETPSQTRVDLTTSYEPKLGPRWVWRPIESLAVHTLHRHVLSGMAAQASERHDGRVDEDPK